VSPALQQRPIIPGFHPDPSICRVGDTYYLVTSSFEYAPGVPIFSSTDLRSWTQIGNVLDRPGQLDVSGADASGGVFAPTLRYHDGRFWMITTNWSDSGGQLLVWADDPAGPWSDPIRIPAAVGIDPDLAWDEDGTCYLTYAGFGPGGSDGIVQSIIDPTGEILTDRRRLWTGTGDKFPEGPHLYRIGDYWYLLIAEGGTERGHAVSIARGPSPQGPFESFAGNPILTHRGSDKPVQNTGHADLVRRSDNSWAVVYHGVRARGSSPEWHVLGRETFAQEVIWVDGWPVLTEHIEPTAGTDHVVHADLSAAELSRSWVGATRFPGQFLDRQNDGWHVRASGDEPVFVGRRQEHLFARVRASLDIDGAGGLAVWIDPRHSLRLECTPERIVAVAYVGELRSVLAEAATPTRESIDLEIRMTPAIGSAYSTSRGPDRVEVGLNQQGTFTALGRLDGRYLSTEVAGGMTGRMIGAFCSSGQIVLRSFDYAGSDDPIALFGDGSSSDGIAMIASGEGQGPGDWSEDLLAT